MPKEQAARLRLSVKGLLVRIMSVNNKKNYPLISVIIPVYGTEDYLTTCLESVFAQTYQNIEVIIVNDASPGNVASIVADYQSKGHGLVYVEHENNRGLFRARISGLEAMSGEYFSFLDADDRISIDFFRLAVTTAIEQDADIVVNEFLEAYDDGRLYFPNRSLQQTDIELEGPAILSALMHQHGLDYGWHIACSKVFSRFVWERTRSVLEAYTGHLIMCEDIAFSVSFYSQARKLATTHGEFYFYCRHDSSSTRKKATSKEQDMKAIADICTAFDIVEASLSVVGMKETYYQEESQWRELLAKSWQARVVSSDLSSDDKADLVSAIENLNLGRKVPAFEEEDYFFDKRAVEVEHLPLQDIKAAFANPSCSYVSFDVFDTLVLRPFWHPTDLFELMEQDVTAMVGVKDRFIFAQLRIEAEKIARDRNYQSFGYAHEVTLDAIYEILAELCPPLSGHIEDIKQLELHYELKFCRGRKKGKELLQCAQMIGKKVICVSDMYLPADFIEKMLAHCGYEGIEALYCSSGLGYSKAEGTLYSHISQERKVDPSAFVHVGDNVHADVEMAKQCGWKAFLLPKPLDLFTNQLSEYIYAGDYYWLAAEGNNGAIRQSSGLHFLGIRCMYAMVANKLFDDPFVHVRKDSDFNANPYFVGYYALGMHVLAIADWLAFLAQDRHFENLLFVARDGFLPKKAFDALNKVYQLPLTTDYLYTSRKAMLPLMLQNEASLHMLPRNIVFQYQTPRKMIKLLGKFMQDVQVVTCQQEIEQAGFAYDERFESLESFESFISFFNRHYYHKRAFSAYSQEMKEYLASKCQGKSATFDVGYNLRLESTLAGLYGFDITACYLHIDCDLPLDRKSLSGAHLETLYPFSPTIQGSLREHLLSELGPSCIGYDCSGGEPAPLFENFQTNYQTRYVTETMQQAALDFVSDMIDTFGADIRRLPFRSVDACMPIEYFYQHAKAFDRTLFSATPFEDDMGIGRLTLMEAWEGEINAARDKDLLTKIGSFDYLNYEAIPRWKRWLIWCLADRDKLKEGAYNRLGEHLALLRFARLCYRAPRAVYRKIKVFFGRCS